MSLVHSHEFPVIFRILGYPWLNLHNLHVDWVSGRIVEWGPTCHATCLFSRPLSESLDPIELSQFPTENLDLKEVFNKSRAAALPSHRSYDCAIVLLPGSMPPRGRIFSARTQTHGHLHKGLSGLRLHSAFNVPSWRQIYFCQQKGWWVRPCIDYRGLNKIRNRYPLPLMSTAFDLLQSATFWTCAMPSTLSAYGRVMNGKLPLTRLRGIMNIR